jgi:hypothetical protein
MVLKGIFHTTFFFNKMYLGYQPCQLIKNRHFKDHLRPHYQDYDVTSSRMSHIYACLASVFKAERKPMRG